MWKWGQTRRSRFASRICNWDIANATRVVKSVVPLIEASKQKRAKGIKVTPEQLQYVKSLEVLNKVKEKEIEDKALEMERLQGRSAFIPMQRLL